MPINSDTNPGAGGLGAVHEAALVPPTACKEASMVPNLRIYRGPREETTATVECSSESHVTVSVGEVLPLLADAMASQRTWLQDFESDDITISSDLFEVLLAYQYFRRPSA